MSEIKKLFNEFNTLIKKCNYENKTSVIKCHNSMNKIINNKKYNIEINVINKFLEKVENLQLLNNCKDCKKCKNCKIIDDYSSLIKFIEYKNKIIIKEIYKLPQFNKLVEDIKDNIKKKHDKNINNNIIKDEITKLLLLSSKQFNGNWNIINCNTNGIPKNIEIIDPKDINFIYNNIINLKI